MKRDGMSLCLFAILVLFSMASISSQTYSNCNLYGNCPIARINQTNINQTNVTNLNQFDQTLNTTSNVSFNQLNVSKVSATDWSNSSFASNYSAFLTHITWANAVNGTLMSQATFNTNYSANDVAYRNTTNLSYYLSTNPFSFYNITTAPLYVNDTFAVNYSNFSKVYGYALNETLWGANYSTFLTHITWGTAYNGTLFKTDAANTVGNFNQTFNGTTLAVNSIDQRIGIRTTAPTKALDVNGTINASQITVNGTNVLTSVPIYVNDTFAANYSNFSTGWYYATNGSTFALNYSAFLTHIPWSTAYNGTLAKTDAPNTFGDFNQTFNGTTLKIWSLNNRVGIGVAAPQNTLNVLGDLNATTTIFSQGNNISNSYYYATNGSYISNTNVTYPYSLNATQNNSANFYADTVYGGKQNLTNGYYYATNGTYITGISNVALTNASNTFGNFNQSFNATTLFVNSIDQRIGIGTSKPTKLLDVNGTINASQITVNGTNVLTSVPIYTNDTFGANYTNFTTGWYYAINGSTFALNYTNFSVMYGYTLNSSGISWTTAYNGTLAKTDALNNFGNFNQTFNSSTLMIWSLNNRVGIGLTVPTTTLDVNGTINASKITVNGTAVLTSVPIYVNDTFGANYTNFTNVYYYALNSSLWSLNYSNFSVGWNYAVNSTGTGTVVGYGNIALTNTSGNTFGIANQTFDTKTFFIDSISHRIGINTTAPQNTLHILGTFNLSNDSSVPVMTTTSNGNISFDGGAFFWDAVSNRAGIGTTSPTDKFNLVSGSANFSNATISNQLYFNTATGMIGFGTSAPTQVFHVLGGALYNLTNYNNVSTLGNATTTFTITNQTTNNLFFINGTSGSIGINTGTPIDRFTLYAGNFNMSNATISNQIYLNSATGKFGIGTSAPTTALHVLGDGLFNLTNYNNISALANQTYNFEIRNQTTTGLFLVNGTSGFVGINNATGVQRLVVAGNVNISGDTYIGGTSNFSGLTNRLGVNVTIPQNILNVIGDFNVTNGTNSLSTLFAKNGLVGINNATPAQTLTTIGTLNISNSSLYTALSVDAGGNVTVGSGAGSVLILKKIPLPFAPVCGAAYNGSIISNTSGIYACGVASLWTKLA